LVNKRPSQNPLADWLSIIWDRPERSYNPELKDFFSKLLGYPGPKVITEDEGASGYPDLKLLSPESIEWIVGDLKKGDDWLTSPKLRGELWKDKQKYVDGLTRYVVFITAHYVWIAFPNGTTREGPFDLRGFTTETLREKLDFISFDAAAHHKQWRTFISGGLPYSYLKFDLEGNAIDHLRADLSHAFGELSNAADHAIERLAERYADYQEQRQKLEKTLESWKGNQHSYRRAFTRLDADFAFERRLFGEALEQFTDQYGRDIGGSPAEQKRRIREAFAADSVAALVSRVLFLRLLEDLNLTKKRRLTNGGPKRWSEFVEFLTSKASMLIRVASEDLSGLYSEPFKESLFDWIQRTNGALDSTLQRLILRLNAYDFSGLSEEILGDVYQQFLPPAKRKRLGEFYTPSTVVDWILEQSFAKDLEGRVLDPACGSGSFIVRALHDLLEDAKNRSLDIPAVCEKAQRMLWGFDLNPFASFISHFQIMWGLLRYLSGSGKSPSGINVYNLNSLQRDDDLVTLVGKDTCPQARWSVIRDVGNTSLAIHRTSVLSE
jgi:hypothetical protein